ncbi:MAG: diguanylate cyclase [Proteobacteria bacterium]|nr:diguanylate cyclase [Pseudomonadota bacterium]
MLASYQLFLDPTNTLWLTNAGVAGIILFSFAEQGSALLLLCVGILIGSTLGFCNLKFLGHEDITHDNANHYVSYTYLFVTIMATWELACKIKDSTSLTVINKLTGLYNKRYVELFLTDIIEEARKHDKALSILALSVDDFDHITTSLGENAGSMVLQELGNRIRHSVWHRDICIYYDEAKFVVVMNDTNDLEVKTVAERLHELVNIYPLTVCNTNGSYSQHECTASIGFTTLLAHDNAESLLVKMNKGLRIAQSRGGNVVVDAEQVE